VFMMMLRLIIVASVKEASRALENQCQMIVNLILH
jgi:hypothetical protein